MPELIQIVPRSPEEPNGVADYASTLARRLSTSGIASTMLAAHRPLGAVNCESNTIYLKNRSAEYLAKTLRDLTAGERKASILLHFSGYGYQKRGVPFWLARGLHTWRTAAQSERLITVFHELYASGKPWQSSFWLSLAQKRVARTILKISSEAITPTTVFERQLIEWDKSIPVRCVPVFSNVGEPGLGDPPGARPKTAIVFGLAGVETRIFGHYREQLERLIALLGIEEIIDVGPRLSVMPTDLAGVPVISKGALPPPAVSKLLQAAKFGFIAYPFEVLGKSGAFAAYAAHGVIPIVFSEKLQSLDGLKSGQHFLDGFRLRKNLNADELAALQSLLNAWYAEHSLDVQAHVVEQAVWQHHALWQQERGNPR